MSHHTSVERVRGRNRRTIQDWLEGDGLWAPGGDIAGDIGAERCQEAFLDVANAANAEAFDFGDGEEVARGGRHENGIGGFQIGGPEVALATGNAVDVNAIEEHFAGDTGQAAAIERGCDDIVAEDGEEIRGSAFTDAAEFIEQDDLVKTALLGFFVPGEITRPGGDLGAAKLIGAVAGIGLDGKSNRVGPVSKAGREGDGFKTAGEAGGFKQAAVVADDGDAESGVVGVVGGDQRMETCEKLLWRFRHGHTQPPGITRHTRPMPLPGEQDAIGDTESTEDAPAIEKPDLPGEQAGFGGLANGIVVQKEAMHG